MTSLLLLPLLLPLLQIAMEFGTTSRLAQSTAAAVQFGVDPQDALDKISKLQERLSTLEQVRHSWRGLHAQCSWCGTHAQRSSGVCRPFSASGPAVAFQNVPHEHAEWALSAC
jgi:hypothetical protein